MLIQVSLTECKQQMDYFRDYRVITVLSFNWSWSKISSPSSLRLKHSVSSVLQHPSAHRQSYNVLGSSSKASFTSTLFDESSVLTKKRRPSNCILRLLADLCFNVRLLTAVEREVSGWCGRSIENSSVQEVDGGLRVDDLEHLTEQQAQLLRRCLNTSESRSEPEDA